MALLKFNKGLVENLTTTKTPIAEGNVYITSDSKEMYIDVASDKRIKISDFVFTTQEGLATVELHDNLFYYVTDTKAIVRYAGTNAEGARIWEGINNTDQITTLNGELLKAQGDIASLKTADTTINQRIDGLNAESIKSTDEIIVTTKVGNYDVNEKIDANTSLQDLILNMLCSDSEPAVTQPGLTVSGTETYIEVGSNKDVSVTATFTSGSYPYGYALNEDGSVATTQEGADGAEKAKGVKKDGGTGVVLNYLDINYNGNILTNWTSGNSISVTVNSGVKTSKTTTSVNGLAKHSAGNIPVSILSNKYKDKAIAENTNKTAKHSNMFKWYVPMFKGFKYGTDLIADPANITAAQVAGLTKVTDATAYNETKPTAETATGSWKQFFVAVPKTFSNNKTYTLIKEGTSAGIADSNKLPLTVQQAKDVTLTFGTASIVYEVFYVNLDAAYDTKAITLTWVEG